MRAPVIEEAEHSLLGIEINMGMSPRNGWVRSVPVVSECHVIFSCQPPIRVDNFRKTAQEFRVLISLRNSSAPRFRFRSFSFPVADIDTICIRDVVELPLPIPPSAHATL